MKIAIDCRYLGMSGIGRVCEGILDNLDYKENNYYLIGNPDKLKNYPANVVCDLTNPYSIKGLFSFDKKLNKTCEAIIIPNFLVPFGIKIPVYTIMHDLAFLDVKVTTKGFRDRLIKKILLKRCMKKSKKISCVSNFTKSRCEHYYPKYAKKCFVNYNGLCKEILEYKTKNLAKQNNIVFVGNVKPHKGLKTLIEAYKKLQNTDLKLKIIGEKDNFAVGLDTTDLTYPGIEFTGRISDEQLCDEIFQAKCLVLPSQYEGFGFPPLEALYLGTKPIISDIEVFKEVYDGFDVEFFKVDDSDDLCEKLKNTNFETKDERARLYEKYNNKNVVKTFLENIDK